MKFAARLAFIDGKNLRQNVIIETDKKGKILNISESEDAEFLDGIIVPGFFNCHTHLEFAGHNTLNVTGLVEFIQKVKSNDFSPKKDSIEKLDRFFYNQGIKFIVDICNTSSTIQAKKNSKIQYLNCVEILKRQGISTKSTLSKAKQLYQQFKKCHFRVEYVPHSCYTMNSALINFFSSINANNFASIHFYESDEEKKLYDLQRKIYGKKMISYSALDTLKNMFKKDTKLLIVHGTYINAEEATQLRDWFTNIALCLCPTSNLRIEKKLADSDVVNLFENRVFLGTDSNLTNPEMSILKEMYLFQHYYKKKFEEVINAATLHPAMFFGMNEKGYGIIKTGSKPGLNLLTNIDLNTLKFTKETKVKRLI